MTNFIKCPACGEINPPDQEFCQNCQTRLSVSPGPSKGADDILKPGQAPTKKTTAELEPILPQWLKDARDSARNMAPPEPSQESKSAPPMDLLAGLQSQSTDSDDEDVPDWLTNITGGTPKPKKAPTGPLGSRRVELGDTKDFPREEPAPESDTPPWLAELASTSQPEEKDELSDWFRTASGIERPAPAQPPAVENEAPDWLRAMAAEDNAPGEDLFGAPPAPSPEAPDWLEQPKDKSEEVFGATSAFSETPDWLRAMAAEDNAREEKTPPVDSRDLFGAAPASDDTPDWLRAMASEDDARKEKASSAESENIFGTPASDDTPDWLRTMASEDDARKEKAPPAESEDIFGAPASSSDVPDWLKGIQAQSADSAVFTEPAPEDAFEAPAESGDMPDWLKGLQTGAEEKPSKREESVLAGAPPLEETALPSWLSGAQESEAPLSEKPPAGDDVPSWLKAVAPQEPAFEGIPSSPAPPAEPSTVPDWLSSLEPAETAKAESKPASQTDDLAEALSAFKEKDDTSQNADELFTDLPDWLSNVDETVIPSSTPAPITNADAIAPGELPSWVQAMRPVDSAVPASAEPLTGDRTLESRGALAGLQGVLPAVPGFSPASKPKTYSIRMQATEEQQSHAALLEQILAAETAPEPISSFSMLRSSRGLRWLLAAVLLLLLTTALALRIQIFALPASAPQPPVNAALSVAQLLPEGAPVLVAFDYEPARAGEMEAAAAPMFDQMLLLHHPRFAFIATSESGAILAERFISSSPLAGHAYQRNVEYVNLGYLPGGQMGIYAFAQDPRGIAPYVFSRAPGANLMDIAPVPAWAVEPWSGINSFSQFAAFILITDNADSARAWVEQTTSARGTIPVVVISSAQAAPMIQPYYDSQQVTGMIAGLRDGAVFEQNNVNRPGTAQAYWNAYSIGLLAAAALITIGGLWNLALGLRDRAAVREAK